MSAEAAVATTPAYPLRYDVEYPEKLSRMLIFVKWLLAFPHYVILYLISGANLSFAAFFTILFRRKYPRWWFDFLVSLYRYEYRLGAYVLLLRDDFPALEEEQAVRLEVDPPTDLNRWLPLVKWLLAIPHYIVLIALALASFFVLLVAWFAILFTGRFPRGLFDFVVGVNRWWLRVAAYAFLLFTDEYPPFSLK
jgi:hypothetical protein